MKSHVKVNYKCTKIQISWHDLLTIPVKCDANVIENSGDLYDEEIKILQEFSCVVYFLDKIIIAPLKLGLYSLKLFGTNKKVNMDSFTCHVDHLHLFNKYI